MADAIVGSPADPSRGDCLGSQDRADRLGDTFPRRTVPLASGDGRISEPTPDRWGVGLSRVSEIDAEPVGPGSAERQASMLASQVVRFSCSLFPDTHEAC